VESPLTPRVDVDPRNAPVRIPSTILHEMMKHALETGPEECCGLIVGDRRKPFRHVHRCHNEMTARHNDDAALFPRDNHSAFYMSEADIQAVQREAERTGMRVTAVYHSHVGAGAYLSDMDLEFAERERSRFPDADWIVLAVFDRSVGGVALFRPGGDGFRGHSVESVTS
jgi:proteasome lid subunit RPN8/RPN11